MLTHFLARALACTMALLDRFVGGEAKTRLVLKRVNPRVGNVERLRDYCPKVSAERPNEANDRRAQQE